MQGDTTAFLILLVESFLKNPNQGSNILKQETSEDRQSK